VPYVNVNSLEKIYSGTFRGNLKQAKMFMSSDNTESGLSFADMAWSYSEQNNENLKRVIAVEKPKRKVVKPPEKPRKQAASTSKLPKPTSAPIPAVSTPKSIDLTDPTESAENPVEVSHPAVFIENSFGMTKVYKALDNISNDEKSEKDETGSHEMNDECSDSSYVDKPVDKPSDDLDE